MTENTLYEERVTSIWTKGLFVLLTFVFALLASRNINGTNPNAWGVVELVLAAVFLFYTVNYAVLIIRISDTGLHLRFGLFRWTIPVENIASIEHDDDLSPLYEYGGAGIHWYVCHGRYRASWNMLEHPRVVVRFKEKVGRAVEVSFTTMLPDEVVRVLAELVCQTSAV